MRVDDYKYARKIRKAVKNMRGVRGVWSSPEQGLVVVHGTADAWALRRRIWDKLTRRASVLSDGSAPYPGTTSAPRYDPPPPAHAYYSNPPPPAHAYYSHPPAHGYYSNPPPPAHAYYSNPPAHGYYNSHPPPVGYPSYAAGRGYNGWAADPDPYGYAAYSTVPTCSIL